jgi:hypothetical protein
VEIGSILQANRGLPDYLINLSRARPARRIALLGPGFRAIMAASARQPAASIGIGPIVGVIGALRAAAGVARPDRDILRKEDFWLLGDCIELL